MAMWRKLRKRFSNVPPYLKNIYFITGVLFVFWMLFLDENNMMTQYRRHRELSALLVKRNFYAGQISQTDQQYHELTSNPATQEKFAREHYWMKRDNEDVFVITTKDNNKP
jgi:hypothetical protein